MRSALYGVGVNDVDYVTEVKESYTLNGKRKQITLWKCPFYRRWRDMLHRCYSTKYLEKKPSYQGCYVCEDWKSLSNFKAWMETQDWEGRHLDKDLLIVGNKVYSPETCVFISPKINSFLTESNAIRGEWPIGVSRKKSGGKFLACCNNPFTGKYERLGIYELPDDAHNAWIARKLQLAVLHAEGQSDERVAKALIHRYQNYKLNNAEVTK